MKMKMINCIAIWKFQLVQSCFINKIKTYLSKIDTSTCPSLKSLKSKIPPSIWSTSNLNENSALKIGETFNLKCPDGLKISHDNDSYNNWDDLYTIGCSPLEKYIDPEYWPTCVEFCRNCLPDAPEHTKLQPVLPSNTIPVGRSGEYVCTDQTLGIMEVK